MIGPKTDKAIVIGAGFGGLAAAVRLRAMGYDVVLCEATDQLGGRASVWKRDGFSFDAGPTVITAPYLIEELFALVGKRWQDYYELMPVDPFYRIEYADGSRFDYVGDEERLLENIRQLSPSDVDGYRKMALHAERIFDIGYTKLADQPFDHLSEMFRVIPDMIKLQNYHSVYGLVSRYIKDERLRQAFSFQPLLVGGNPFSTTSIYMLIHWLERKWGVHFAKGGTTSLVNALGKLLKEIGVEVRLNAPVEEILVTRGKTTGVRLANGETLSGELVACNGDPNFVYRNLVPESARRRHTTSSLNRRVPSMSLFVAYFGTKKTYPELAHHTIILGPRYKPLLQDIFKKKVLAEDFSLYLHAPTRSDASLAPGGHECFYVLSPVPNNQSGLDWSQEGPRYMEKILSHLDKTYLPGLKENLVSPSFVDPRYFEGHLRSVDGAAFGLEPRFSQSAYFRFHNKSEDVEGLYFVGASTHPGAGVPGVLCSAKVLAKVVPLPSRKGFLLADTHV
jgi:phytoene desaturase